MVGSQKAVMLLALMFVGVVDARCVASNSATLLQSKKTVNKAKQLTPDACSAHFTNLVNAHGIRHPNDILGQLQHHSNNHWTKLDVEKADCETTDHLLTVNHSTKVIFTASVQKLAHPASRHQWLGNVISRVPDLDVYVGHDTQDVPRCGNDPHKQKPDKKIPAIVSDSYLPDDWVDHQLFVPISTYLWKMPTRLLKQYPSDVQSYNVANRSKERTCYWRGSPTGRAPWQSLHHVGRTTCPPSKTDRQCVIDLGSLGGLLNASFGKDPNIIQHPQSGKFTPGCTLAMDGYGFAGIFSSSLLQGSLTVRVGGYKHDASSALFRRSEFAWFEPLLVEGRHYFRTDIDDMSTNLQKLFELSSDARAAVAENGLRASRDLFSRQSIDCYVALAAKNFAEYYDAGKTTMRPS